MTELDPILEAVARKLAPLVAAELAGRPGSNPNQLLTVPELAAELGICEDAVRKNLINTGKLAKAEGFRETRVSRKELERYTSGRRK